jgi:hypothetical protein
LAQVAQNGVQALQAAELVEPAGLFLPEAHAVQVLLP